MKIISLLYFRKNVQKIADRVKRGEEFIVLKKNEPLFKLTKVETKDWETKKK